MSKYVGVFYKNRWFCKKAGCLNRCKIEKNHSEEHPKFCPIDGKRVEFDGVCFCGGTVFAAEEPELETMKERNGAK